MVALRSEFFWKIASVNVNLWRAFAFRIGAVSNRAPWKNQFVSNCCRVWVTANEEERSRSLWRENKWRIQRVSFWIWPTSLKCPFQLHRLRGCALQLNSFVRLDSASQRFPCRERSVNSACQKRSVVRLTTRQMTGKESNSQNILKTILKPF